MTPHIAKTIDLLVVDDKVADYQILAAEIREADFVWQQANDGHRALQVASGNKVRLWISNMQLPDMSGIELLQLIRAKRPAAAIYLVSDHYSADEERQARAAGAAGYLCKPADQTWFDLCQTTLARITVRAGPHARANPSGVT